MKNRSLILSVAGLCIVLIYALIDPASHLFPPCPFRYFTGWLCPGCGSQRAMHQILHFQFGEAFRLNQLILPALGYCTIGIITPLALPGQWKKLRQRLYGLQAIYIVLAIILLFWFGRNLI